MEKTIKLVLVGLAAMLAATGLLLGTGGVAVAGQQDSANDQAALKRDEDDGEELVARDDDDDDDTSASRFAVRRPLPRHDHARPFPLARPLAGQDG